MHVPNTDLINNTLFTTGQNYFDHDLDNNLDHCLDCDLEYAPVYTEHTLLNMTKSIMILIIVHAAIEIKCLHRLKYLDLDLDEDPNLDNFSPCKRVIGLWNTVQIMTQNFRWISWTCKGWNN